MDPHPPPASKLDRCVYFPPAAVRPESVKKKPLEPIRIVLIDMPQLLRGIVRGILADQSDLAVVAEIESTDSIDEAVVRHQAQFVIVGVNGQAPESLRLAFERRPRLRALAIESDGRESFLYELQPRRLALGEISPDALLHAIRAVPTWITTS